MKPARPWFRFYSEALSDRKIRRIAKALEMERVVVVGAWVGLLCLASDSPERGALLLTDEMAFTIDDLSEEIGCSTQVMQRLLGGFQKFQMLEQENGVWYIFNWNNRQFESDYSAERVRRWREKRLQETLQKRHGNPPETEAYTEKDTKTETEKDPLPPKSGGRRKASKSSKRERSAAQKEWDDIQEHPAVVIYCELASMKRPDSKHKAKAIIKAVGTGQPELRKWRAILDEYLQTSYAKTNVRFMLEWFRDGIPTGHRGRPPPKTKQQRSLDASKRVIAKEQQKREVTDVNA